MKELVLQVNGQIGSLLYRMCTEKEWNTNLFIASESMYRESKRKLQPLIDQGYISLVRRGKNMKASLNILSKGREEVMKWQ